MQQPAVVNVGGLDVMPFTDMAQLVQYIVRDDGSVFAGSAIAINPEKVMKARSDAALRDMLNQAEIRYADGMGVVKVMRKKLGQPVQRVPGCETWEAIMLRAAAKQVPVFLVGAKPEVLAQTQHKLEQQGVLIAGTQDGYFKDEQLLIEQIKHQEPVSLRSRWVHQNKSCLSRRRNNKSRMPILWGLVVLMTCSPAM